MSLPLHGGELHKENLSLAFKCELGFAVRLALASDGAIDVLVFRPRTSNIFFEHSSDSGQCSGTSTQYLKFCA